LGWSGDGDCIGGDGDGNNILKFKILKCNKLIFKHFKSCGMATIAMETFGDGDKLSLCSSLIQNNKLHMNIYVQR